MFNFGGSGVMSDNTVTNANDTISANWSTGTQFLRNHISKSGSGVHTDNNGGDGEDTDLIQGNTVSGCTANGYGIFVFVPYVSQRPSTRTRSRAAMWDSARTVARSRAKQTFSNNTVWGGTAKTTDPNGTYGAYLTTDQLGYAFGDLTATLKGN